MSTHHEAAPTPRGQWLLQLVVSRTQNLAIYAGVLYTTLDSRNRRTLGSRTSECATTAIDGVCSELGRCRNDFELRSVCKPCFQDLEGLGKAEAKVALLRARFLDYLRPRASTGLSQSPAKRTAGDSPIAVTPTPSCPQAGSKAHNQRFSHRNRRYPECSVSSAQQALADPTANLLQPTFAEYIFTSAFNRSITTRATSGTVTQHYQ